MDFAVLAIATVLTGSVILVELAFQFCGARSVDGEPDRPEQRRMHNSITKTKKVPRERNPSLLTGWRKAKPKSVQHYAKAESVDLRMIDLNLFRVFDAMILHRSVCKASRMLSVTPSAVSHALSRLRQSIVDEPFIPTESGMQPTRRALELAPAVREGLGKLELALTGKESAPTKILQTFRIGAGERTG